MQIEELVEAAARRMAVADGQNPDKLSHNSFEWWRHYVPMARAAIEATLSAAEPVVYVSRKSLEQLNAEGSHVAVQTLIHRVPLRSGNGVPLFAGPLETTPSVAVKALEWRSCIDTALSAQVQDVAGWQPIETAPKDGSSVLGFWSYTYLGDKEPTTGIEIIEWHDGKFHGWKDRDGVTQDGVYTHWMLLPEAPAAPAKQEG